MFVEGALRLAPLRLGAAQHLDETRVATDWIEPRIAHEEGIAEKAAVDGAGQAEESRVRLADVRHGATHVVHSFGIGEVGQLVEDGQRVVAALLDRGTERREDPESERSI